MNFLRFIKPVLVSFYLLLIISVTSCGPTRPPEFSAGHINSVTIEDKNIPATVIQTTLLPPPSNLSQLQTYTVIVNHVATRELLFSIARDAKINLDIHDDITGTITLNAIDQTLPQILERISQQTDIRYNIKNHTLRVQADKPYLETYIVDYVNISRESKGIIRVATNIGSTGQGSIGNSNTNGGSANNNENNSSLTEVHLTSDNKFWETLTQNIKEMLGRSNNSNDKSNAQTSNKKAISHKVIVNREAGLIMVRATYKQHRQVQKFIDQVLNISKRQVMIEATIAEIKLSDHYQAGVDWSVVAKDPKAGVNILTDMTASNLSQSPFSSFTLNGQVSGNQVSMTLKALEQFGDVQVLSSPKIMAINNQPAILKVVDNIVYFEMDVKTSLSQVTSLTTFETQIKTVPVGFVMSVTPYINAHKTVTLNIRPTISRVIDSVQDPNPAFKDADVISEVPVIQIREIESILTINNGDTAVIGGLMQDTVNDRSQGIPLLSSIPIIGSLFRYDNDIREKSELIIFIRPIVIQHASLTGDLIEYKKYLPKTPKSATKNSLKIHYQNIPDSSAQTHKP